MLRINAEQLNKMQDIIKLTIEFRVAIPNGKKNGIGTCAIAVSKAENLKTISGN